jgi:protein-tyrosine phosphatase
MTSQVQTEKPSKKSALRNLALGSHKRRRSPAADPPLSPLPGVATHRVGIELHPGDARIRNASDNGRGGADPWREGRAVGAMMPVFLRDSDIEAKFKELLWMERNRMAFGVNSPERSEHKPDRFRHAEIKHPSMAGMDRYTNIKPWGHNRIRLRVAGPDLDYVNASPIVLTSPSDPSRPPLKYIAMQGPTRQSLDYVWRMMAEQLTSPIVIVQLTNMYENNEEKCFPYFPFDSSVAPQSAVQRHAEHPDGHAQWALNRQETSWKDGWTADLRHAETKVLAGGAIELRQLLFKVQGEENERVVWHFLYTKWPDFGVPAMEDLDSFFELMRLSQEYNTAGIPRVIHCSAGVGRTGTFIALEHLIRELDAGYLQNYDAAGHDRPDLIFATVNALREQRKTMVQAPLQLAFIYKVMQKLWMDKYVGGHMDALGEPSAKRLEVADPFRE